MCINLNLLKTFRVLKDSSGRQYGWKVFRMGDNGEYLGDYCGYRTVRPVGRWLKAKDFTPLPHEMPNAMTIIDYDPGWHMFVRRGDAKKWGTNTPRIKIVKVLVRKVREKGYAYGTQNSHLDCFIADEIFIPN